MKIGVLGAGQLGRMLALSGYPLGLRFRFFDPAKAGPANDLADQHAEDYADPSALKKFAHGLDCVTYEFENVPVELVRLLQEFVPHVFPPPEALEASQDRWVEKSFFRRAGIETADFARVDSLADLQGELKKFGTPAILKTRRMGYDGKGQFVIEAADQAQEAFTALGGKNLILERFVQFDRELSIIAARSRGGASIYYPLVENTHRGGILRTSRAPARNVSTAVQAAAEALASRVMDALNYCGIVAIELFEKNGALIANEMACRVHNSGHWTIEGAETSQFENHLRAGLDFPLGSTRALGYSAMVNLIGSVPDIEKMLGLPGAHLHLYNKAAKPGRKLGHVTVVSDSAAAREEAVLKFNELVKESEQR